MVYIGILMETIGISVMVSIVIFSRVYKVTSPLQRETFSRTTTNGSFGLQSCFLYL